jgi:hypothetical protein
MDIDREAVLVVIIALAVLFVAYILIGRNYAFMFEEQDKFSKQFEIGDFVFEGKPTCGNGKVHLLGKIINKKIEAVDVIVLLKKDGTLIPQSKSDPVKCGSGKDGCEINLEFAAACDGYGMFTFWINGGCVKNNLQDYSKLIKECSVYYLSGFDAVLGTSTTK